MVGARWTAAAVIAGVVVAIAGCGGGSSKPKVTKIAIVTPGRETEIGWSQQGITAARAVARRLGLGAEVVQGVRDDAVSGTLERLAGHGASLLIAHSRSYAGAAARVAARTSVPALVFGDRGRLKPGSVGDVEVASQEGGYLAGYIAARASFVRSVGIVVAADDPNWYRTAGGFIAGARRFDPKVKIRYADVGPAAGEDAAASQRAAHRQIRQGTQMVLGLGDGSTLGVMKATMTAQEGRGEPAFDAMFIDVVGDKAGSGHISITGLTAVVWNFEPAYRQAIRDLRAGTFGKHAYTLDLANGGVSVIANGRTPMDNYAVALKLGRKIERGEIKVPVTSTDAEVRALLRQHPAG